MNKLFKIFTTAVATAIVSAFICGTAYATEFTKWTVSNDGATLSDGTNTYEYYGTYDKNEYEKGLILGTYHYENYVWFDGASHSVRSYEKGGDILSLYAYDKPEKLYVTPKGKEILDAYFGGKNPKYKLWTSRTEAAEFDAIVFELLQKKYIFGGNHQTIDVTELKNWHSYELTMHDELFYFTRTVGAIHINDSGDVFFIDYDSLGNQYFDANGDFSFRKGTVEALRVDDEMSKYVMSSKSNSEHIEAKASWEDSGLTYSEEEAASLTPVFYVGLILLGFVFPLPFLVIGIVFPRIKKFGKPKYWYILAISSGVWMAVATALIILIFTA